MVGCVGSDAVDGWDDVAPFENPGDVEWFSLVWKMVGGMLCGMV